ncbi:tetratricopeptide repeat protein [Leptospira ellisii]|uniref:Tetratricopeptide repeat protein n=1 Tax=Leptospira ellisii TaxID=2023197 RepID=A0A2N0BB47_9LEPT|nr:tetratricopeptide repeat protein [Leptospira ellisii]MDV6236429.1 tetratricopeptide repeat protein [Leptospira ellisii]PJZ93769.1 hypothetical protein CH379_06045 [Leptospira ellisii]PKA05899.1 hypothetical protein CH375_02630 [Leptospira ellisii]
MQPIPSVFVRFFVFLFLIFMNADAYPDERQPTIPIESYERGENFLKSAQFVRAENIARSFLKNNPSDPKAEFILTKAWIGIAKTEKKKGNYAKAKLYFQKARLKWPLNRELNSELDEIAKGMNRRDFDRISFDKKSVSDSNTAVPSDSETGRSIRDIKEGLYQTALVFLTIVSILNLIFTIYLWRKK